MKIEKEQFLHPDRKYAIYPIVHQGIVAKAENAAEMAEAGFAGVVGNINYTEDFPHNEEEWDKVAAAYRKFADQGMHTWIYDEKGYPSGSAGGAVLDERPDLVAEGLYCYEYWRTLTGPGPYRADVPGDRLYSALLLPLDGGEAVDVTDCLDEKGTLRLQIPEGSYHLFMMSIRRLFDGTHAAESYSEPRNYICLSDKEATEVFIKTTYDHYAEKLQDEFGKSVLAFFTDEPSLIAWNIRQAVYPLVPWNRTYPTEFKEKYGYPIELAVSAVVTRRGPQVAKRRCDYWEFVADTVADGYFGTIQNWCRAHGVKFSGHMLEEERLAAHVINYGSFYRAMSRMDWPGIDQLDSEPQKLMDREKLPIARLVASFADINGEHESFTEFSDHTSRMENKQIGMNWIQSSVNWHAALGINNFTSYYSFAAFSAEEIKQLNDYTARLGYLLRQGKRDSRVALFYPDATIWTAYTPSVAERGRDYSEDTLKVEETFRDISWELLDRQIDYDYVDEALIRDGEIKNGCLCYKDREYKSIVFPAVKVLCKTTMDKIEELLKAGIGIVFVAELPSIERETGEISDFSMRMMQYRGCANFYYNESRKLPGKAKISALNREMTLVPDSLECVLVGAEGIANIVDGEIISSNILSHMRVDGDTRVLFLTNMGLKPYEGKAIVKGACKVELADPETGAVTACEVAQNGEDCAIPVSLKAYQGVCYIIHGK